MEDARITKRDRIGNDWADQFAERGAAPSSITKDDEVVTVQAYHKIRYSQKWLASASIIHNDRPTGVVPKGSSTFN